MKEQIEQNLNLIIEKLVKTADVTVIGKVRGNDIACGGDVIICAFSVDSTARCVRCGAIPKKRVIEMEGGYSEMNPNRESQLERFYPDKFNK